MNRRCYNKNDTYFHRYGGRGILVCEDWNKTPKNFIEWAENNGYKKGLQIDRIDNDGPYSPENCRFVPSLINVQNSTVSKLSFETAKEMREMYIYGYSKREISKLFCCSDSCVGRVIFNKTWIDKNYTPPLKKRRSITDFEINEIMISRSNGETLRSISTRLKRCPKVIRRALKKHYLIKGLNAE
jgi:hypothetical protein